MLQFLVGKLPNLRRTLRGPPRPSDLVGLEVLPRLEEPHALGLVLLRPTHLGAPKKCRDFRCSHHDMSSIDGWMDWT